MIYKPYSDITLVKEGIIAHGVNRQRKMGTGVAKALLDKWPFVKDDYMAEYPMPELGEIREVRISNKLSVINCYTQEKFGYDGKKYAEYNAIVDCMIKLAMFVGENGKINIPMIGAGRGGLSWYTIEEKLLGIEKDLLVEFIVHTITGEDK